MLIYKSKFLIIEAEKSWKWDDLENNWDIFWVSFFIQSNWQLRRHKMYLDIKPPYETEDTKDSQYWLCNYNGIYEAIDILDDLWYELKDHATDYSIVDMLIKEINNYYKNIH